MGVHPQNEKAIFPSYVREVLILTFKKTSSKHKFSRHFWERAKRSIKRTGPIVKMFFLILGGREGRGDL